MDLIERDLAVLGSVFCRRQSRQSDRRIERQGLGHARPPSRSHCETCIQARKNSAAGSTRWPTSQVRCPSQCRRKPRQSCRTYGWLRQKRKQTRPLTCSLKLTGSNTSGRSKKLTKDRDVLLTFYDFPAEHWKHIRTTNPIESVFAAVRNRTRKTKGCLNRKTALSMVFKLMMSAKKKWRNWSERTAYLKSFKGLSLKTGSSNLKTPPNQAITNFWAYLTGQRLAVSQ
jgi:hypothetical protein